MRIKKSIIPAVMLISLFGVTVSAQAVDFNEISAYYGFGEMEIIKLNWRIKNLIIADFNGDGSNDIAVANNRKAKIELLIQKESIGPGEKTVAVDPNDVDINEIISPSRFDRQSLGVSQKITSLVRGDLNSDGMMDLAFHGEPKGLYIILQKPDEATKYAHRPAAISKTLSWQTRKKIKIDDGLLNPNALVCADLNNDGKDDLVLAGRDAVYVILQKHNLGNYSLAEPIKYPTTATTLAVKVSDLNGDGRGDLILITDDIEKPVYTRFGLETGQLGPQVQFFIEKPYALQIYDYDGSTGDEILTVDAKSGRLNCYKYTAQRQEDPDWPILFYPLDWGKENIRRDLVLGDFDGNGLVDIVISDPGAAELIFYKQLPGFGLTEPVRFPAFADITHLSTADIDGDKKKELAVLSIKEKAIGISKFEDDRLTFPKPIDLAGEPLAMELADVDSDRNIDCLYISKDSNDVRSLNVIYNLASYSDTGPNPSYRGLELGKLESNPQAAKVVDVDQDGLQDVLIFVEYEQPILVHQTGRGQFEIINSPKSQASLIKDATARSLAVADINGQKGQEILIAQQNFARSLVFAKGQKWDIIDQYNAKSTENNVSAVAAFDLDQDDLVEILLLDSQKGQLQILRTQPDKTYRFAKELDVNKWNSSVNAKMLFASLTGDAEQKNKSILLFDGDKFALIAPPSAGSVPYHLEKLFGYETKIKDGKYGNLTAGDINSDGKADIIMVEYKRNHIEILTPDPTLRYLRDAAPLGSVSADLRSCTQIAVSKSSSPPIPAMRFKVFEQKSYRNDRRGKFSIEPRELEVTDVTGDGKDDLIVIIHDRIIIYPQD